MRGHQDSKIHHVTHPISQWNKSIYFFNGSYSTHRRKSLPIFIHKITWPFEAIHTHFSISFVQFLQESLTHHSHTSWVKWTDLEKHPTPSSTCLALTPTPTSTPEGASSTSQYSSMTLATTSTLATTTSWLMVFLRRKPFCQAQLCLEIDEKKIAVD